jgi:integrase/recombinase XerD
LQSCATRTAARCGSWQCQGIRSTTSHTAAICEALSERYAPATANKHLAALKRTLKEAWRLGLMHAEAYQRAADVQQIKAERLPRGRALSAGEIAALLSVCTADPTVFGVRDAALIAMLRGVGMRRAEAVALDLSDYNPEDSDSITIRAGKGNKDWVCYLPEGAALFLADWLACRGAQPGPLFSPIAKGGKIQPRRMTDQAVFYILDKPRTAAGMQPCSPHDMRRTLLSGLLNTSKDVATVRQMARHNSINITARYDRRGKNA